MLAFFEHFSETKVLSIIQAFKWHFSRKLTFFSQNIEIKIIFYEKMKTKLPLFTEVSLKGEKGLTEQ